MSNAQRNIKKVHKYGRGGKGNNGKVVEIL